MIQNHLYPEPLCSHISEMLNFPIKGDFPFFMPRIDNNKCLWFYICTADTLQLNEIKLIVNAHLGNGVIAFDPVDYKNSDNPNEKIVIDNCAHGFSRFHIPPTLNQDKKRVYWILETLNKLVQAYHNRPKMLNTAKRPVGIVLRSFFTACSHHHGQDAYNYYLELKKQQALSNRNLLSLEFQALYASRNYSGIVNHLKFQDSISVTIPRLLQSLFLKAIMRNVCSKIDFTNKELTSVQKLLLPFRYLFFSPPEIPDTPKFTEEWKCWFIGRVVFEKSIALSVTPSCIAHEDLMTILEWADIKYQANTSSVSPDAINTLDALSALPPSEEVGSDLFKLSIDCSAEDKSKIYNSLTKFSDSIIEKLIENPSFLFIWENLQRQYDEAIAFSNWNDLIRSLSKQSVNDNKISIQQISNDSFSWEHNLDDITELEQLILSINTLYGNLSLRDILPLFIDWIGRNDVILSVDSLEHLVMSLVMDDKHVKEDLLICSSLFNLAIIQPHTKTQYISILEALNECWNSIASVSNIDIAIGAFEEILDSTCLCDETRLTVWSNIETFSVKHWSRLSIIQQTLIRDISAILIESIDHFPQITLSPADGVKTIDLTGKKLAIYSLTESALTRASALLKQYYPELEIRINSDKTATEALKHLVESCDYFIFSSKSAAHQAFYTITDKRKDLIYPQGKGSSSIVKCFTDHVSFLTDCV